MSLALLVYPLRAWRFMLSFASSLSLPFTLSSALVFLRHPGEFHGCGKTPERYLADAQLMRGAGTRLDVANKNIGAYKYSFNPLQVQWLPSEWQPPPHTVQTYMQSIIKRDS